MDLRSNIGAAARFLFTFFLTNFFFITEAQQTPLNPISLWIFEPYVYNPAMAGSKDFLSVDLNASFQGKSSTQFFGGNTRLSKTKPGYFSSPDIKEFNGIGIGWSAFHDINKFSQNTGVSVTGSYQIPLSTRKLSFLSFGASVKGVYNLLDTGNNESGHSSRKTLYPNVDLGIYYYGTNLYTGISSTNILGPPSNPDSLGIFKVPVRREYFFTLGYKFLISKSLNIVLEPSVLVSMNDSTYKNIKDNINPIIKLYLDNLCLGSYFLGNGTTSFFFQYRYPKFFIGAFFELPNNTAYYKSTPLVEFTFGLNIQTDKSRLSKRSHW